MRSTNLISPLGRQEGSRNEKAAVFRDKKRRYFAVCSDIRYDFIRCYDVRLH